MLAVNQGYSSFGGSDAVWPWKSRTSNSQYYFCIIKWTDNNVGWTKEDDIGLLNDLIAMGTHNVAQIGSRLIAV